VQNQVRAICSARHLKSILKAGVKEVRCGLELAFSADQTALDRLCRVQLGKTILLTDNAQWSNEEIVLALTLSSHLPAPPRPAAESNRHLPDPHESASTAALCPARSVALRAHSRLRHPAAQDTEDNHWQALGIPESVAFSTSYLVNSCQDSHSICTPLSCGASRV
jgi:hypothetical protein